MKKAKNNVFKPTDLFDQFIKDVFVESPLEEAFRNWNKTSKQIKENKQK
tara:strand:- start:306 stop:452 length:147 start_codon:yes stop_codon:yes gene_type:complete